MNKVAQKSAIGVNIDVTVKENNIAVDLSTLSTKQYIIRKPNGTLLTKAATFKSDGTDGKLRYTTISGDLDATGNYLVQLNLVFSGGYSGRSDIGSFDVVDNL